MKVDRPCIEPDQVGKRIFFSLSRHDMHPKEATACQDGEKTEAQSRGHSKPSGVMRIMTSLQEGYSKDALFQKMKKWEIIKR